MSNIESSPHPLAFPLAGAEKKAAVASAERRVVVRTLARALEGMQKEAIVSSAPGCRCWRMVSDEGPYLNGTDLAPFPLAFFTTGLANSFMAEILLCARARGVEVGRLEITQDNFYAMEGSAIRGDMRGHALPVELQVRIGADGAAADVRALVLDAVESAPAQALLRDVLQSEFAISRNGGTLSVGAVRPWNDPPAAAAAPAFRAEPDATADFPRDIITKLGSSEVLFGVEGGAGSSLQSEQKRTLHVRGVARLRPDGLAETEVQLYKPLGSNFRFLGEVQHGAARGLRAPAPLAYLSAGIAFCYLTQIGRYVAILKHDVEAYAIVQDTIFMRSEEGVRGGSAEPVRTRVDLTTDLDDDTVRRIVDMGEQTCFLHAAARTALAIEVRVEPV